MEIIDSYQVPKGFGEPTGTDNNSIVIGWYIFHLALLPLTSLFLLCFCCAFFSSIYVLYLCTVAYVFLLRTVYTILASPCIHACFLLSVLAAIQDKQRREPEE